MTWQRYWEQAEPTNDVCGFTVFAAIVYLTWPYLIYYACTKGGLR